MRWITLIMLIFIVGFLTLAIISCQDDDDDSTSSGQANDDDSTDDDDDDSGFDDPTEEGRYWLKAGVPERAKEAFGRAIIEDPQNEEARYGTMLASSLHLWELVTLVTNYLVDQQSGHDFKDVDPNRELIRLIIENLQTGLFGPSGENIRENALWLEENGDPPFVIDDIPVQFLTDVTYLGSQFDSSERHACQSIGNLFDGSGSALLSMKLDFSLGYIFTLMDTDFDDFDTAEIISIIVDMLDRMLNDEAYPNLFRIEPDMTQLFEDSRIYLGTGMVEFKYTFDAIRSETDNQGDDVLAYLDANANGMYDPDEVFMVSGAGQFDKDTMALFTGLEALLFDLGAAILDRTEYDLHPAKDDPFHLSSLNVMLNAFGLPSLIPGFITVDIASFYEDIEPNTFRNMLQTIINLLKLFLPEPPDIY